MKKQLIRLLTLVSVCLCSCKNDAIKITNVNDLIKEFNENSLTTIAKYKGQIVEFTGTFKPYSEGGNFSLLGLDENMKINDQVRIVSNYNKDSLKRNSIFPYLEEKYFYDENTKEIYTDETMKEIASSVLTNSDQTTNNDNKDIYTKLEKVNADISKAIKSKNYDIDTAKYLQSNEIVMNEGNGFYYAMDSEIKTNYPDLINIQNDIKSNKIHICDTVQQTVVDKVIMRGKIKDITSAKTNSGQSVIVITLDNAEIVNKERVFDFSKLPILNYTAGQTTLNEKIKSIHAISPNSKYYKVNDPNGADLMVRAGNGYKSSRTVLPNERFEIVGDQETFWSVKFEDGTMGSIDKTKVIKFE